MTSKAWAGSQWLWGLIFGVLVSAAFTKHQKHPKPLGRLGAFCLGFRWWFFAFPQESKSFVIRMVFWFSSRDPQKPEAFPSFSRNPHAHKLFLCRNPRISMSCLCDRDAEKP